MMRCIHCGGIDGDHHELCGGDDTQPPSEGMTLAQIIDKQVARIATQEAEINRLQTEQVEMQRKLSNSNSIVDTQAAEMAQYEKACKQFEKTVEEGEATIEALREQLASVKAAAQSVCDEVEAYRSKEARRILNGEQLARMPVCVGYITKKTEAELRRGHEIGSGVIRYINFSQNDLTPIPIYTDPAPQEPKAYSATLPEANFVTGDGFIDEQEPPHA